MLSERLRQLREENGYTQRNVAEYLNIDRSTYSYYEIGKTRPDIEVLKKLSSLYHVSIDYIADNATKMKSSEAAYEVGSRKPGSEMSSLEKEIISLLRGLPENEQQRMRRTILELLKEKPSKND